MAEERGFKDYIMGLSSFWLILITLALSSSIYLLLWSYNTGSIAGVVITVIMMGFIFSGVILSRNKIFDQGTWGENTSSFTIGFFLWWIYLWLFGAVGQQSTVALQQQHLLSSITGELPQIVEIVSNSFLIPIAEELFWMIGLPYVIISILNNFKEKIPLFGKAWFQILVVILISATSFAYFHIGNASLIVFIITAMFFRTIMIAMVYSDKAYNTIKAITLTATFSVGAHLANNIFTQTLSTTFLALQTEPITLIIVLLFFGVTFISGFNNIVSYIAKKVNGKSSSD